MASLSDNIARLFSYWVAQNKKINTNRGTLVYEVVSTFASSATDTQNQTEQSANQSFLGTATGQYLIQKAADYGVTATVAVPATGQFIVYRNVADPNNAWTQPSGTVVSTQTVPGGAPISFITSGDATIPAGQTQSNQVTITCQSLGMVGNVGTGLVSVIQQQNPNISGGYNIGPTTGGTDQESDASLLQATLSSIQPSNTVYAIAGAAQQVTGVFAAAVYSWADGLGNYTCYACAQDGTLSSSLQSSVLSAISAVDGIGYTRHVQSFSVVSQTVYANLAVSPSYVYGAVASQVQTALSTYIGQLPPGTNVTPFALQQVVDGSLSPSKFPGILGVVDFVVTTPSSPVVVGPYEIVRLPSGFVPGITQIEN